MTHQELFTNALRLTRAQGGGSARTRFLHGSCYYIDDPQGRACVLGQQRGEFGTGKFPNEMMRAHNDSVWASNSDAEFFALWEPRMQAIARDWNIVYTPPESDGFDRFMAKVREPVQFCPVRPGEWA